MGEYDDDYERGYDDGFDDGYAEIEGSPDWVIDLQRAFNIPHNIDTHEKIIDYLKRHVIPRLP